MNSFLISDVRRLEVPLFKTNVVDKRFSISIKANNLSAKYKFKREFQAAITNCSLIAAKAVKIMLIFFNNSLKLKSMKFFNFFFIKEDDLSSLSNRNNLRNVRYKRAMNYNWRWLANAIRFFGG